MKKWKLRKRQSQLEPWERKYNIPPKHEMPKEKRVIARHNQFTWMVFWGIFETGHFDIDAIVNKWWSYAFTEKPFPKDGGRLEDLYHTIARKLYEDDAEECEVDMSVYPYEKVFFILKNNGNWRVKKDIHIKRIDDSFYYFTKEVNKMAKKTAKDSGKGSKGKKATAKKATAKKATAKKATAKKATAKTDGGQERELKNKKEIKFTCQQILARKKTDQEIREMLKDKFDFDAGAQWVGRRRRFLSKGLYAESLGFDGTKDGSIIPNLGKAEKSSKKKSEKKSDKKSTAKKKAVDKKKTSDKKVLKKKLKFKFKRKK